MEDNGESELFLPTYELQDFQKSPGLVKKNYDILLLRIKTLLRRDSEHRKENSELEKKTIEQNAEIRILKHENEDLKRQIEDLSRSSKANLIVAFLGIPASACTAFGINYVTSNSSAWYGWVLFLIGVFCTFGGILVYVIMTLTNKK